MSRKHLSITMVATLAGAVVPIALTAAPAQAACPYEILYSLSSSAIRMPFSNIPTFKNGPGGHLSVTRSYSGSVSAQVTVGAESEVGVVLARAKVSISASLTASNSTGTTNTYSRTITAGKYGHAQYVSWGRKVNYTKSRVNGNCTTTTLGYGTINFPANEEGWYYWETSS